MASLHQSGPRSAHGQRRRLPAPVRRRPSRRPQLAELIGELSLRDKDFRSLWADHDVLAHATGTKHLHHPLVGDLTLDYVTLNVAGAPDQSLVILTSEPASPSAEALSILASWTDALAPTPTDEARESAG
ncbi:MmyB family transcriptional regulator [Streptomyces mirabilis]|uniref:MmyB family transcriptional regulator n=1 Tax=Streptomyces mirabilis TaxID=68239 RepID=UPI0036A4D3D5